MQGQRRNLLGELMTPGHTAVTDFDGEWKRVTIVAREDGCRSQSMVMMQVEPAMKNGSTWLDSDWLFPDPALTQWYVHDESCCAFLDEPNVEHDGLAEPADVEAVYNRVLEYQYELTDLDAALLYAQLSRGY